MRLTFKPTIAGDVIRLNVKPEVSSLDFNNGITLPGFRIPALTTRRAETEVELRDGQSFAIAGLLNNTLAERRSADPLILSALPIIGNLFKSKAERAERTELMVLITPRLVRPLDPDEVPPLPTRPRGVPAAPTGDEDAPPPARKPARPPPPPPATSAAADVVEPQLTARSASTGCRTRRRRVLARAAVSAAPSLVHVAVAMMGLLAFTALVMDYGVLWMARRQAQNAADAAALAGAMPLPRRSDSTPARAPPAAGAQAAALRQRGLGRAVDSVLGGSTSRPMRLRARLRRAQACVNVDVYRDDERGKPAARCSSRGCSASTGRRKATATAESVGNAPVVLQPLAVIADRWKSTRMTRSRTTTDRPVRCERTMDPTSTLPPTTATQPGPGLRTRTGWDVSPVRLRPRVRS